ncbi:MAG: mechanosensitive ion channel [Chloroflexi bacterium]|nr:mechanosensitive ion channel [Chloroflexota bacterium]
MTLDSELLIHILQAIGLSVGAAILLRLLGRFAPVRRVQASALAGALAAGAYIILRGSGIPNEAAVLRVVAAFGLMLAANALLQLFDLLLWDYILGRRRHMVVPRLLVDLFNFIVLVVIALAVLKQVFNVDLSALVVTSTVVSAVIGLALQDMLGNVVAGLALQLERPFAVGDWVLVSGHEGQVVQLNWRTLTIKTRDSHNVIVPNANVAKQEIINYSRPTDLQRMHATLGVAYRHPPVVVKEALFRAAAGAEGVAADPPPEVIIKDFGEFAVHYDVRYWLTDYARAHQIGDSVLTRIWYELRRADITIPFPARDVTVRTLTEDHETRAQAQLRRDTFAELRPLAVFAPLSDAQIETLVRGADLHRYTAGETLVRQGDAGDSLFVIKSGQVRVDVRSESGQVTTVAVLHPGDFFGEMSLLTGEPRTASVVAQAETEVVVVDKPDFAAVLAADTGILDGLSLALETRARNVVEQVAAADAASIRQPPQRAALVKRIRGFFGVP